MPSIPQILPQQRRQNNEGTLDEKLPLVQPAPSSLGRTQRSKEPVQRTKWTPLILIMLALACLRAVFIYSIVSIWDIPAPFKSKKPAQCIQVDPLHPALNSPELVTMDEYILSSTFRNESAIRLGGAVQIKTESFDDMGAVGDDSRWDVFFDMSKYLQNQFPLINSTLQLERVNTHGLLYTWKGSDESLKPTVLMAHQDVVPVVRSTLNQWTHDAFGGYFDGQYVWGRGSSDCKNSLIGIMEAVELLVSAGFKPKRTIILSYGFDEEISGRRGAADLASFLVDRYEKTGGAAIIVDEGDVAHQQWGTTFAVPGVAEKGYIDVEAIIRMPGGHSSIPPPHTGIGVAAELISAIEAQPYQPHFYEENPFLGLMQCAAAHSSGFPHKLKNLLSKHRPLPAGKHDKLATEAAKLGPEIKFLFTTSQAVDIIDGGSKNNALPERTRVLIDHRINVGERSADVKAKLTKIASTIAHKHNLTLHAFTNETESPSSITLRATESTLEPAPVTPTLVDKITPYSIFSGTLRALYGTDMIVAPGIMTGNTDTRYYWGLSKHIFRYGPGWDPDSESPFKSVHTVNEKVSILTHVRTVQWYSLFIRNIDEAMLE